VKKVVFCIPTLVKPYQVCLDSLAASVPLLEKAGWETSMVTEVGCPYISSARATMLRKSLDAKADVIVFIDHDLSWDANDLVRLVTDKSHVTAGTYRFKREPVEFMGLPMRGPSGKPVVMDVDGDTPRIQMHSIPAGFLKITKEAVNVFMAQYPELCYGDRFNPHIDLFNHGAHEWTWYGEDYAFSRRWNEKCGQIWLIPDLNLKHWSGDVGYGGTYHEHLISLNKEQMKLKAVS